MWQRIKTSFKLTFSNFGDFVLYLITPIVISIPFMILFGLSIARYTNSDAFPLWEMIAFFIFMFVLIYTFYGAVVYYVYLKGEGKKVKFFATVKTGFHKFFLFFVAQVVAGFIAMFFSVIPLLSIFLFLDPVSYAQPFAAIASLQLGIKILLVLMAILSVVISIFFSVHYSLIPFLVIADGEGITSSRKKSYQLIKEKGFAWKIFGTFFIYSLLLFILNVIIGLLAQAPGILMAFTEGEYIILAMIAALIGFALNFALPIVNMGSRNFLLYGFYRDIKGDDHDLKPLDNGVELE